MACIRKCVLLCVPVLWLIAPAVGGEVIAIKADRVETVTSGVIENGVIVIKDGRIAAIGNDIDIPEDAEVIDVSDKTVFPGLVNAASRMGLSLAGGGTSSTPHYRVVDELYPHQDIYKHAARAGFTTIGLGWPGSVIGGQGAIIRPVGKKPEDMIVAESGFLMVNFRASDRTKGVIKGALESVKTRASSSDPKVQPLIEAFQGRLPTYIACNGPGDALHLLKLLEPYTKIKAVLLSAGPEIYRVSDRLAKKKIGVILPARLDTERNTRNRINVPKMLSEARVKISLFPRYDIVEDQRDFLRKVGELVKYGLEENIAKRAITIHPAEMLGVGYRVGSIEKGKDANLLVLSGDILDAATKIEMVMIEGKVVHKAP